MSSITIHCGGKGFSCSDESSQTLLELLRAQQIFINAPCGGHGTCGKCRVTVKYPDRQESVQTCSFYPRESCEVVLPETEGGVIETDYTGSVNTDTHTEASAGYGAAIDLGTTTVVVELFYLKDGKSLGRLADWNAQRAFGADVIARAQYAAELPGGLEMLTGTIQDQLGGMLGLLCTQYGVSMNGLKRISVCGNTIMQHLLFGLNPAPITIVPFLPDEYFLDPVQPKLAGLRAEVTAAPCVSGYVGGDITAGLLASGLYETAGNYLYLDIGTNGELALGGKDGFLTCATACGPAFEGAQIACGMASLPGAITHVAVGEEDLKLTVADNAPIRGICGSGLIDLAAILAEYGIIDGAGRLLSPEDAADDNDSFEDIPEKIRARLEEDPDENGIFYLSEDRTVYLTAGDVRKLQLAKGAVAAGIELLLSRKQITEKQLDGIVIAGGFGGSLNLNSAERIGMLPPGVSSRTSCIGNSALAGAAMVLSDPAKREKLLEIRNACRYLELSGDPEFPELFAEHMMFSSMEDD